MVVRFVPCGLFWFVVSASCVQFDSTASLSETLSSALNSLRGGIGLLTEPGSSKQFLLSRDSHRVSGCEDVSP